MEQLISDIVKSSWPMVGLVVVGWYFMSKYFMNQIDRKDQQNQANLDRFISLVEKTNEVIAKVWGSLDSITPKLHDIHEDIKLMKNK